MEENSLTSRNFIGWVTSHKVPLYKDHEVSDDYREPAIRTGYRPEYSSTTDCVISVFRSTNETVNFWSHFIPAWYFLWQLCNFCKDQDFMQDTHNWPFLGYMFTACAYPFTSCVAHVMSCLSARARHICYFFDYTVLSIFSYGSGLLCRCYSFPEQFVNSTYSNLFLLGCIVFSLICTGMACASRFTDDSRLKILLRLAAFTLPYIWVNYPLVYRLTACIDSACQMSFTYHLHQYVTMISAGLAYGSHFPECLAPGRFDFIGNSHNILHICGILATYAQMHAGLVDLKSHRYPLPISGWLSVVSVFVATVLNVALTFVFIYQLHLIVPEEKKKKR